MNGAGNRIVVLDLRGGAGPATAALARAIDRAGRYDQLMALHDPRAPGTDARVTIRNADGSAAGACGNGMRCAAWAMDPEGARPLLRLETVAGVLPCRREGPARVAVGMGAPRLRWDEVPLAAPAGNAAAVPLARLAPATAAALRAAGAGDAFAALSMGNPHAVFVVPDAGAVDLAALGPPVERDALFPERVNASFLTVLAPDRLSLRVWERGAGATLACGSAACAALVAAARAGLCGRRAAVDLPGGTLDVAWEADGGVVLAGPVQFERWERLPEGADALADDAAEGAR